MKRDPLKIPAFLLFMASLLWIGFDLFSAQRARQRISQQVNEAFVLQEKGHSYAAFARFQQARDRWSSLQGTPAQLILEKVQPGQRQFTENAAVIHRSVGTLFSDRQMAAHAEKHYTLALLQDPGLVEVAAALMTECYYTKNFELGWVSSRIVRENPGTPFNARLATFFEEGYEDSRQ